jgi:uncharacterized membrane protein
MLKRTQTITWSTGGDGVSVLLLPLAHAFAAVMQDAAGELPETYCKTRRQEAARSRRKQGPAGV